MRYLISTAALALCLAATTAYAAPVTTASSVFYELGVFDLTVTPTGPTTLNLNAGDAFHLEGTFAAQYDSTNPGCGNCRHQLYLAGLSPLSLQINLIRDGGPFQTTYSADFTAPLSAGIYYIGAAYTLQFGFINGVTGSTNANGQVSYILNVAPAAVPEPTSLLLLGTGLLGVVRLRRRGRAS
jgi:hypothetical protein